MSRSRKIPSLPAFCRGDLAVLLVLSGAALGACGAQKGDDTLPPAEDSAASGDGTEDSIGFDPDTGDGTDRKVVKLTVEPDGKTIEVVNGDVSAAGASLAFSATATLSDGSTTPYPSCTWTVDRIDLGAFTGSTFKASGTAGGSGKVTCKGAGLSASAGFSVFLRDSSDTGTGLADSDKKALVSAVAGDPTVNKLLYPYDATVFPRGLLPPELMWNGASGADVYALRLEEPGMEYTAYFKAPVPSRASIPKEEWTKLLDTASPTVPVKMTLFRLAGGAGGTPFKSTSQSWTIAAATLKGSIYFWSINRGYIARIKPGATAPEDFIKPPAGHACVACHSVSADGSTLVASYDGGAPNWATWDVKTAKEVIYSTTPPSGFQAVTPDGSLVAVGQSSSGTMQLRDSKSGASYEPSGAAALGLAVHPAFSPDGKWIAFGVRYPDAGTSWLDWTRSDLALAPFDQPTKKFGGKKTLRDAGGRSFCYPTFSPDSQWVAYMDAPVPRTRGINADLRYIKTDATGDVLLGNLGNGGVAVEDRSLNFEPTFNPVFAGGYFWVVFVSSRKYGNRLTNTKDSGCAGDFSDCRHKQLWVAAIDASPKPGVDPSHPAFWFPGQDLNDQNMRGYWALDPCKKLGEGCEAGFECCEGTCKSEDGKSPKICVKPPPGTCKEIGDKCVLDTDCCEHALGVQCIGGVCGKKLPS